MVYQAVTETSITGLDCDPPGEAIYLTHRGSNRAKQYVRKVRVSDGITLWSREPLLDTYNDYVFDLSLSPGGSHVYVLGYDSLFKIESSTGDVVSRETRGAAANRYMRIACGEEFVYSTTLSGVLAHNKTTLLQEHSYSLGSTCRGLSMSPDGDVIVTSQGGSTVKLTPSLGLVWQATSPITPLTQAKVGKSGDVYVATGGNGSLFEGLVRVYDSDGNFKYYFATSNDQVVVSLGIYQPWLAA
ncbi:WD40 repeat domain-containing protein [Bisbaumannia pacifica]|uniref:WD40 repeat domain-containing protein n=1 Tax=Bisbaumannia pacifica TaxID=77098 RepID=A0ABD4KZH9_9GAMM|nr:WD40 repeat domain-containing protein [Halomonas pacifica]MBH8578795.1 WD40 repeat domain-containing protein [Halomonas pacifica]